MLEELPSASRGAILHQSPRRTNREATSPLVTPSVTPATSPERKRRDGASAQDRLAWSRQKAIAPATINVAATQYAQSNRGHQFTVGNVSNGLIYLRPVIKPASERHQNFIFPPSTPPSSAEEIEEKRRGKGMNELSRSCDRINQDSPPRTPTRNPAIERSKENVPYIKSSPPVPRKRHQRSRSYSTVDDHHLTTVRESTYGNVQVRIDQYDGGAAREDLRPRTAGHQDYFQSLEVQIPHYNLGSPRFSPNGTPFLYGASSLNLQSTTGEMGSSHASQQGDLRWLWPGTDHRAISQSLLSRELSNSILSTITPGLQPSISQRMMSQVLSPSPLAPSATLTPAPLIPSPPVPIVSGPLNVSPEIYDDLTFPPGSENPSAVRYDSQTREISAATPARIIAQITSAAFVDYHLLSDFFLTYRLFMNPNDLASHLIARLRWAIDRGDDTGKVVRVRTFVAIRHWLLNYFADDFVPSLSFRREFAKALNELTSSVCASDNISDLKIIGELKKCWRRTCALYWDSPVSTEIGVEEDISPGGPPGTREEVSSQPQSSLLRLPQLSPAPRLNSVNADKSSGTESFIRGVMQGTSEIYLERKNSTLLAGRSSHPSRSGDVSSTNSNSNSNLSATTSSGIVPVDPRRKAASAEGSGLSPAKKLRPSGPHKRSGSFSDALRDNRYPLPLPNPIAKSTQLLMELPYAGSLVRGNLFPPSQAFVEVIAPSTPVHELSGFKFGPPSNSSSSSAIFVRSPEKGNNQQKSPGGPGMKRIFGSVRKALSGKPTPQSSTNDVTKNSSVPAARTVRPSGQSHSNLSTLGSLATNSSHLEMGLLGDRKLTRIDLLGAGAVEAFQKAMLESDPDSDRQEESFFLASGDDSFSRGGSEMLRSTSGMDGATDARTDVVVELGSSASNVGDNHDEQQQLMPNGSFGNGNFLDSPSTINPQDPDIPFSGDISFLADKSEQTVSSRNSAVSFQPPAVQSIDIEEQKTDRQDARTSVTEEMIIPKSARSPSPTSISGNRLLSIRRSKSFSFERAPMRLGRAIGHIDENSSAMPYSGPIDNRSLYSGRSFSLKRANSVLSQFSIAMDNISEFSEFSEAFGPSEDYNAPKAMLRRRPGGNLRAAATIGKLEPTRPKSTGSIAIGTYSVEAGSGPELQARPFRRAVSPSNRVSSKISDLRPVAAGVVSLGAMGKGGGVLLSPPPHTPEFPDRSSNLEPCSETDEDPKACFEAGVQLLRDLPDDDSDDGGVEVALAKLEGTYQRKKSGECSPFDKRRSIARSSNRDMDTSMVIIDEEQDDQRTTYYDNVDEELPGEDHTKRLKRRHKQVLDHVPLQTPPIMGDNSSNGDGISETQVREEPEDFMPVLERGISVNTFQMKEETTRSYNAMKEQNDTLKGLEAPPVLKARSSAMDLQKVDSELEKHLENRKTGRLFNDNTSELSSELSFEMIQKVSTHSSTKFPPVAPGTIISELGIASHPLRHPPSPPLTLEQALSLSPGQSGTGDAPRTPRNAAQMSSERIEITPRSQTLSQLTPRDSCQGEVLQPTAVHLPFILAYDSELLAKQFTLIEKDALLEVDWKELVELSWRQTDEGIKDWVELLNSRDIRGVEVVIARFNLMCKWARSEIVMTRSADERARTIVKMIHIAAHARALYNYATMYQITIALLTADIARLRKTWDLVNAAEKATFRELEALVQPVRNFHNLRSEMDKVTGESGCIPFVGLFTHDLILNAQRPPFVSAAGGKAKKPMLVNFERHRMTAAIVKRLLRLIEASHKYTFEAVDGVCERCLWVSALGDDEIKGLSKGIE